MFENVDLWLTPIWLLSVGTTLGALVLAVLYGLLWLVNRKAASAAVTLVSEGVLMPIVYLIGLMAVLAVLLAPRMPLESVTDALGRLPAVGTTETSVTVPAREVDYALPVSFVSEEMLNYSLSSDQDVRVTAAEGEAYSNAIAVVQGDVPYDWNTKSKTRRGFAGPVETIYLTNEGDAPAEVTFTYKTEVRLPQVRRVPLVAASVVGLALVYLGLQWLLPGIANIAVATSKEAIGQPMFLLFTIGGAVALIAFIFVPYNTFGEDVKMLKDSGLSTVMVLAILFAVWTASVSIADEIEGKTALTLLSKPISRRQFILGKYVGILWSVLVIFVLLGALLMATISVKVVYDARESSNPTPDWQLCHSEMIGIVPGLVLSFFEAAVLTAISVAISTRLPMLPNLIICGSIYVLGHLTPLLVQSSVGQNEFVAFFGRLVSIVLPMLDHLNIQAAIAGGQPVPFVYLAWTGLYTVIYVTVAMLLALILFEDRDLA
ncbi:ABC-2 family transporter protein [Pseudobythopirellula maris]|uniref:ABC-2 family transporter protein n=1 Tax=Pseudobythopirellula maris TaxID=2527991 RepID=A0A5C5ZUC4_9BACT|nr:ABC transporter permease [Pseudobythopirellula maris]TWT90628.1 ABC-2 family transporter protein [Pseudobythopirellula maris]